MSCQHQSYITIKGSKRSVNHVNQLLSRIPRAFRFTFAHLAACRGDAELRVVHLDLFVQDVVGGDLLLQVVYGGAVLLCVRQFLREDGQG